MLAALLPCQKQISFFFLKNMNSELDYVGKELDLFAEATHWKSYWSSMIGKYLGSVVLDVGAGIGSTAKVLNFRAYKRWVELEPDPRQIDKIKQLQLNGEIPCYYEIITGTLKDFKKSEKFDTILYVDVLEHIQADEAELKLASELASLGGRIVIICPAHNFLYTKFDASIGHFRRYNKKILRKIVPLNCEIKDLFYLDSIGMLASLANKLLLKEDLPSISQIKIWDRLMVPLSTVFDKLFFYTIGKSIVMVIEKKY